MQIIMIRHSKVYFQWHKWSTSIQFNNDCRMYDLAPVKPFPAPIPKGDWNLYFVSSSSRSRETAYQIFGDKDYISSSLLDEVPLSASIDTNLKLPLWFWNITGRLQWCFHSSYQKETRKETQKRAQNFVDVLLEKNEDCAIVTHGFFMHSLIAVMEKNGFVIANKTFNYSNGQYIIAER